MNCQASLLKSEDLQAGLHKFAAVTVLLRLFSRSVTLCTDKDEEPAAE